MLLPILYRIWPERTPSPPNSTDGADLSPTVASRPILPLSPPLTPPLTAEENVILNKHAAYDSPNTYLTPEAFALPDRQCTLCLEPRGTGEGSGGTVGVTECGHIFCWGCLGGLEKVRVTRNVCVHLLTCSLNAHCAGKVCGWKGSSRHTTCSHSTAQRDSSDHTSTRRQHAVVFVFQSDACPWLGRLHACRRPVVMMPSEACACVLR